MNKSSFCAKCGCEILPESSVCPYCNAPVKRQSRALNVFFALLKCLGYYAFFFGVQLGVSFVYELIIMLTTVDFSDLSQGIDMDEFYAEYSRFAPEIGILTAFIVLLGYFLFFLIIKKNIFRHLSPKAFRPSSLFPAFAFGLTSQIIISLFLTFLYMLFPGLADYSNSEMYELMFQNSNPVTEFINISIVTGILEEVVFRGMIYNTIKKATSPAVAVIVSAVIFGIAHMNIEQFFYTALLGALMAMIYEVYGNIVAPIIVHATFNGSNYLLAELDFMYGEPYLCMLVASVAVFIITFAFVFLTKKEPVTEIQNQRKA